MVPSSNRLMVILTIDNQQAVGFKLLNCGWEHDVPAAIVHGRSHGRAPG